MCQNGKQVVSCRFTLVSYVCGNPPTKHCLDVCINRHDGDLYAHSPQLNGERIHDWWSRNRAVGRLTTTDPELRVFLRFKNVLIDKRKKGGKRVTK